MFRDPRTFVDARELRIFSVGRTLDVIAWSLGDGPGLEHQKNLKICRSEASDMDKIIIEVKKHQETK